MKNDWRNSLAGTVCLWAFCLVALFSAAAPAKEAKKVYNTATADQAGSIAAFQSILTVIRNPRCMNCHSTGDFPRQGTDGHQHSMNVRRGPIGWGVTSQKCNTCHQDHNLADANLPPGAPNWHLPPAKMPMIWQGLTDGQICQELKDPQQNGHRSVDQIVEHMTEDKLVAWGWGPGPGRTAVSMPKGEFSAQVIAWASKGASCPEK